jgi:hypothetical protein
METDVVTDADIAELGRQAEKDQDVRLQRVCRAALDAAAAKSLNIRSDFAREQCERVIREQRAYDAKTLTGAGR